MLFLIRNGSNNIGWWYPHAIQRRPKYCLYHANSVQCYDAKRSTRRRYEVRLYPLWNIATKVEGCLVRTVLHYTTGCSTKTSAKILNFWAWSEKVKFFNVEILLRKRLWHTLKETVSGWSYALMHNSNFQRRMLSILVLAGINHLKQRAKFDVLLFHNYGLNAHLFF